MIGVSVVLLTGAASVWLYGRAQRWADAALAALAALALAGLLGDFKLRAPPAHDVPIDPQAPLIDLRGAASVRIDGDGMSAARWRDLPARPLQWEAPATPALDLSFPRSVPPGGVFTLAAGFGARTDWRLQLMDESGRVLAESSGGAARQAVQWTAPAVEDIVLRARLLDAGGRQFAEGPIPLRVEAAAPLRVRARFSAPSFDTRALRILLEGSGALLDWQVALGPGVVRHDIPRAPLGQPDLIVVDAPWLERTGEAERTAVLAQVQEGARLLVLGAHARRRAFWAELLSLDLAEQDEGTLKAPLLLTRAALAPVAREPWSGGAALATRTHGAGRIGWLGVADWHRHAIAEPRALALWWQGVLAELQVARVQPFAWVPSEAMPLVGQRLEVCAQGARGEARFPQLRRAIVWQTRADRADAACVALWPTAPGWLEVESNGRATRIYVYGAGTWPAWQAHLKREATRRYAARTPMPAEVTATPLPAWPFAGVFALAMLGLWWRERGALQSPARSD